MHAVVLTPYQRVPDDEISDTEIRLDIRETLLLKAALKRFPKESNALMQKFSDLGKQVSQLSAEKSSLETGYSYWFIKEKQLWHCCAFLGGSIILASSIVHAFIAKNDHNSLLLEGLMVAQILVGLTIIMSSFQPDIATCGNYSLLSAKFEDLDSNMEVLDLNQAALHQTAFKLEALALNTLSIETFCAQWKRFAHNPRVACVKELFINLQQISTGDARALFSDRSSVPSSSDNLFLILMDDVCSLLKNGPLVQAWENLKAAPSLEAPWAKPDAEPWKGLRIENPTPSSYASYFKNSRSYQAPSLAEIISEALNTKLHVTLKALT